jgi:chromosome segregation ATPase
MARNQRGETDKLEGYARELSRNITRKGIIAIAKRHGWEIVPAGKERLKARRDGYASVSIPGENDGTNIANGTAFKIIKSLLKPSLDEKIDAENIKAIQQELLEQKHRAEQAEQQLKASDRTIVKLKADIETGLDLAQETENQNRTLNRELNRYSCWIQGLKQRIANIIRQRTQQEDKLKQEIDRYSGWIEELKKEIASLIEQRAQQEEEMLEIADEIEEQELRIQKSATMLTEFSGQLPPAHQRKLKRIIRYLSEEKRQ